MNVRVTSRRSLNGSKKPLASSSRSSSFTAFCADLLSSVFGCDWSSKSRRESDRPFRGTWRFRGWLSQLLQPKCPWFAASGRKLGQAMAYACDHAVFGLIRFCQRECEPLKTGAEMRACGTKCGWSERFLTPKGRAKDFAGPDRTAVRGGYRRPGLPAKALGTIGIEIRWLERHSMQSCPAGEWSPVTGVVAPMG